MIEMNNRSRQCWFNTHPEDRGVLRGSKLSEKHKKKISEALKGKTPSNYNNFINGKRKGIKESPEVTQKRIEKLKQIKRSEEFKSKISKGMKGKSYEWLKGRKLPIEQRLKMSIGMKGKNSKGRISEENHRIRTSIQFRLWREAIFARDNWTCQKCFVKGGRLNSHHIKPFAKFPELRFAIDNGITFCIKCHKLIHILKEDLELLVDEK